MLVEHLTLLSQNTQERDTQTISPATERHFRTFARLPLGKHTLDIEKTPFTCRVTIAKEGAIFDLLLQDTDSLLFINVCCFRAEDKYTLLGMIKDLCNSLPTLKSCPVLEPKRDYWLYSIPIAPFLGTPDHLMTAGEIEFYLWNAFRKAVEKIQ